MRSWEAGVADVAGRRRARAFDQDIPAPLGIGVQGLREEQGEYTDARYISYPTSPPRPFFQAVGQREEISVPPPEIVDLSQEIYDGMPVFDGLPEVRITVHATHESWDGLDASDGVTPGVHRLEMGEHTGTHVDAISHMARPYREQSIDRMPLESFYTEGLCLDVSDAGLRDVIEVDRLQRAVAETGLAIAPGDTVLLHTDHYRRFFGTDDWPHGPGISAEAARWLGGTGIAAFGVETMSPGVPGVSNREVHRICGELGFTHYENLANLHRLVGRGRFRFIALPLKIRGGTGSPVRAVAVFDG